MGFWVFGLRVWGQGLTIRNEDIGRTVIVTVGVSSAEVAAPAGARLEVQEVDGRRPT